METTEQDQGGLKKKVATGVAVGLATTAAAGVAKKLMGNGGDDQRENVESQGREAANRGRQTAKSAQSRASSTTKRAAGSTSGRAKSGARSARKRTSQARSTAASKTRSARSRTSESTKEQLYARAKRLGIEGRSKMSKAQLQRAVSRAK
jgi:hypothetical protein